MIDYGPSIVVKSDSRIPPFEQIVSQICDAIRTSRLHPGDALPTVRQLAGDLGIAPNTVARAYQQLQEEGWLVASGRRGTQVANNPPLLNVKSRTNDLREAARAFTERMRKAGNTNEDISKAVTQALTR
ncbi:MAG: GntR family transcriptional regulator [Candidatus Eremiobacter antarcticus]|nr:GntR family transcriptional regulator [Candidatus Eremiobacteraeota bacterium]PZR62363.1 MAG: GntR family transcriptional regulator [Candidatus Eremiobacter sp. RRmetagenome_bin22]